MSRCEASGIDTRHALFAAEQQNSHFYDLSDEGQSSGLAMTTNFGSVTCRSRVRRRLVIMGMSLTAFSLGPPGSQREEPTAGATIDAVVERIIGVESDGDPNATNKRSSATGLGQFLDETWLDMIRAHRPDLARDAAKRKSWNYDGMLKSRVRSPRDSPSETPGC